MLNSDHFRIESQSLTKSICWGYLERNVILYPENCEPVSGYILDTFLLIIKSTQSLHPLLHNFSRLNKLLAAEERGRISIIHQTTTSCKTPTLFLRPFNCWLTNVDKHSGKPSTSPWVDCPLCHQLSQWASPVKSNPKR